MISLTFLLWAYALALCIHVTDEYNSNGGFVNWVKTKFYPEYTDKKFLIANTAIFILHICFILLYSEVNNKLVILPFITSWIFTGNGIAHWIYTIRKKEHSPGFMTSPIYWILMYFILRYYVLLDSNLIKPFIVSFVIGGSLGIVSFYTFYITKLKSKNKS